MHAPLQRYLKSLLLTLLPVLPAWSEVPGVIPNFDPHFEIFELPGGEVANMVQCIIQDKVGFLWFGTRGGLVRYDGRQMVTYRHNPLDTGTIAADYINWIFEDSKGVLWLGHCCDGLTASTR
ncbi:MAG: hypothetical protein L6Q97_15265 [Thermoanaerobaculia bacterium]|nr:hypothetical protein [Thermoanaerobaculia bacterium]